MQSLIVIGIIAASFYAIWLAFFPVMVIKRLNKVIDLLSKRGIK